MGGMAPGGGGNKWLGSEGNSGKQSGSFLWIFRGGYKWSGDVVWPAGSVFAPFRNLVPDLCAAFCTLYSNNEHDPARDEQPYVDHIYNRVYDYFWLFSRADGLSAWDLAAGRRIHFVDRHHPGFDWGGVVAHSQAITEGKWPVEAGKSGGKRVKWSRQS